MRIFLYEHVTATCEPSHPLYTEGAAMRDALRSDLSRIPNIELVAGEFDRAVTSAEACILIAPETGEILEMLARRVHKLGGTLFGPHPDAIRLTGDKLALAKHWQAASVPTPKTSIATAKWPALPAILKPRDGAGSENTFLIRDADEYASRIKACTGEMIVQPLQRGEPCSVAFLIGPRQTVPLRPTVQRLGGDSRFQYLGGELPLPPQIAERAIRLGRRAVDAVPGLLGYVGVDLILGEAEDGRRDFAIETNPRLTASYIGLRAATTGNIAEALLAVCDGLPAPDLSWIEAPIRWDAG